jgi:hypothetical protein
MNDDASLEEIEARLDELDDKKEQADELSKSFNGAVDSLGEIQRHPLVDDEAAAKVSLLKQMLRQIRQHDVRVHEGIHHEREGLRRQRWELKREEENGETHAEESEA